MIMAEEKRQFDEDLESKVSGKLSTDLKALFKPQHKVPAEIDRAVMDRASQHFVRRRPRLVLRWAASTAAVAAVVMVVAILTFTQRPALQKANQPREVVEFDKEVPRKYVLEMAKAPKAEVRNEFVMAVAKKSAAGGIKDSSSTLSRSISVIDRADFDHSGRVDILDAFKLAKSIESAKQLDTKCDINGDGIVNRSDVDSVAYVAVCLNTKSWR
jgi:hypothetical protein